MADEFTGFGLQAVGLLGKAAIRKEVCRYREPHTCSPEQVCGRNPFVQAIKRTDIVSSEWGPTGKETCRLTCTTLARTYSAN